MTSDCATAPAASPPTPDLGFLGSALGRRLRSVEAAVRRLDNLDGRHPDRPPVAAGDEDLREFVLRALRIAADRDNDAILRAVADGPIDAGELAAITARPRLGLWESVSDLVQVGLVDRDPVADRVTLTGAGEAVLALVGALVAGGRPT